ncbi:FAD-binding oxidoreductase [Natronobacterium texcoconense]|uniref:FAD/FMN-containing dehydrogenase n=1 Tax=Natronobacterium texcoconense TaxID=1095778 RepID=A0A1H1CH16_NATTX|nr:FAD-binding oxidoreductase [Natronobacterium texcoconense]SDQ63467.1 FAD/FMN-containing dehydrogenase [Natronobacterium texcoconense]
MATKAPIDDPEYETLARHVHGEVLRPGDDGYEDARSIWNAMIDRKPAVIVRPTGTADVVTGVEFAYDRDLPLSVKGGGHNVAGNAICDDGLTLDLSSMSSVRVDPTTETARVGPGATMADLDHETQAFGLATPGGVISTTGVAGITLGGGIGWLSRKYGLSIDNLRSVEVVTADGEVVTASEDENPDLFWAIRGGSGNFGIVTSFEFDLHEVGPEVLFGPIVYPYDDASDLLARYEEFARDAPRECAVWANSVAAPPLPFIPEDVHGTTVLVLMGFYAGDLDEGEAVLEPLREFGDPIADAVGPMRYTEAQSLMDDLYAEGARNYWKASNFTALGEETIDTIVEYAERAPTPESEILVHQVGGAVNDVEPGATAYPHRNTEYIATVAARWEDPANDDECIAWVRECHDALAAGATGGTYVNFEGDSEGSERNAYGENYDRLGETKTAYDPENVFRQNQNVKPAE